MSLPCCLFGRRDLRSGWHILRSKCWISGVDHRSREMRKYQIGVRRRQLLVGDLSARSGENFQNSYSVARLRSVFVDIGGRPRQREGASVRPGALKPLPSANAGREIGEMCLGQDAFRDRFALEIVNRVDIAG